MRRNIVVCVLVSCLGLALAGCNSAPSIDASVSVGDEVIASTVEDENEGIDISDVAIEVGEKYKSELKREYYYGEDFENADPNDYYDQEYTIVLTDDKNAYLVDKVIYPYNQTTTNEYEGTYEKKDNKITFYYGNDGGYYVITVDGELITDMEFGYEDTDSNADIMGTYTCESEEFGAMTLTIPEKGKASLEMDGKTFEGYIYLYEGEREFTVYDDETGDMLYDWIIGLSENDKFTYEDFLVVTYKDYAGTYEMVGDLGQLDITVDEYGMAEADVKINGIMIKLDGNVYVDGGLNTITGAWLSNEDGYSLDLMIVQLEDGTWNYSGTLSMPLSAG